MTRFRHHLMQAVALAGLAMGTLLLHWGVEDWARWN